MSAAGETYTELADDSAERQRKVGGYIWRAELESIGDSLLALMAGESDPSKRATLHEAIKKLRELERYRGAP